MKKGLVTCLLEDVFQNASDEEKEEKKKLFKAIEKLNWKLIEAEDMLKRDTEKNLVEVENWEPPTKRQKTYEYLKCVDDSE